MVGCHDPLQTACCMLKMRCSGPAAAREGQSPAEGGLLVRQRWNRQPLLASWPGLKRHQRLAPAQAEQMLIMLSAGGGIFATQCCHVTKMKGCRCRASSTAGCGVPSRGYHGSRGAAYWIAGEAAHKSLGQERGTHCKAGPQMCTESHLRRVHQAVRLLLL